MRVVNQHLTGIQGTMKHAKNRHKIVIRLDLSFASYA